MTKKRFILIDGVKKGTHSGIWDNLKQNNQRVGDELWVGEVVAMLNEGIAIVEENVKLKSRNKYLATKIQRERNIHVKEHKKWENEIQKENEQLKKILGFLKNDNAEDILNVLNSQENKICELKQENEQLKLSFTEFAKMIEFDMDNGIEVYPKRLLEYIINISKEYGK